MSGPDDDRLAALQVAAGSADEELAALAALVRRLRAADPAGDVAIDPDASWHRIQRWLDQC